MRNIVQQTVFHDCILSMYVVGGCPKTDQVISTYLERFPNIEVMRVAPEEDKGVYYAWNALITKSRSEFITNANVDDRLFPDSIEKHVRVLWNNPSVDVVYCRNVISDLANKSYEHLTGNEKQFYTCEYSFDKLMASNLPHNHPVWSRSLHDKLGYFSLDYESGSDWDFWLRCGMFGVQMRLIDEVLGVYYQNPHGISTKKENMPRNLDEIATIRKAYNNLLRSKREAISG